MRQNKIIIFGLGKIFNQRRVYFNFNQVIGVSDTNKKNIGFLEKEIIYIYPKKICEYSFDYVVICTGTKLMREIYSQLINEYKIPSEKIISERKYFSGISWEANSLIRLLSNRGIHSIYDPINYFAKQGVLTMTNIKGEDFSNIILEYSEGFSEVILLDKNVSSDLDINKYPYIIFHKEILEEILYKYPVLRATYKKEKIRSLDLDMIMLVKNIELEMFIITHLNFLSPKYEDYVPLWVGDKSKCQIAAYTEDGDNISFLNNKINECTGIYWIWKNTTKKYVGINHYRRYFKDLEAENIMESFHIKDILRRYDLILAYAANTVIGTNLEQIQETINSKAFHEAYILIEQSIITNQPSYAEGFHEVMKGVAFFPCNMFVMPRHIFSQYCEWLFSIIIPAAKVFDGSNYDSYSRRAVGFFAERLLTVWLSQNNFRIKELPIIMLETQIKQE